MEGRKVVKSVAVIGAGAAGEIPPHSTHRPPLTGTILGAITAAALVRENYFETIRVFERRETPGGTWYNCNSQPNYFLAQLTITGYTTKIQNRQLRYTLVYYLKILILRCRYLKISQQRPCQISKSDLRKLQSIIL
jgi:hypothetical protein